MKILKPFIQIYLSKRFKTSKTEERINRILKRFLFFVAIPMALAISISSAAWAQVVPAAFSDNVQYGQADLTVKAIYGTGEAPLYDEKEKTKIKTQGFIAAKGFTSGDKERYSVRFIYGKGKSETARYKVDPDVSNALADRTDSTTKTFGIGASYARLYSLYSFKTTLDLLQQHVGYAAYVGGGGRRVTHYSDLNAHLTLKASRRFPLYWSIDFQPYIKAIFSKYNMSSWRYPLAEKAFGQTSQFSSKGVAGFHLSYLKKGDSWEIRPFVDTQWRTFLSNHLPVFYQSNIFMPLATLPSTKQAEAGENSLTAEAGISVFNGLNVNVSASYLAYLRNTLYKQGQWQLNFSTTF